MGEWMDGSVDGQKLYNQGISSFLSIFGSLSDFRKCIMALNISSLRLLSVYT